MKTKSLALALLGSILVACGQVDTPPTSKPITKNLPPTAQVAQVATATVPPATLPAARATPTATPALHGPAAANAPPCTFAGTASPLPPAPPLDDYQFAEPTVLLTGRWTSIDGWLPDNQRLLLSRALANEPEIWIETLHTQTGAVERYTPRTGDIPSRAFWLEHEQAVAFTDVRPNNQVELHIARGKGTPVEQASTDLQSEYFAVNPQGTDLAFVSAAEPGSPQAIQRGANQPAARRLAPTTKVADTARGQTQLNTWYATRAVWNPDGQRILFYSREGIVLFDQRTQQFCAITLGPPQAGEPQPRSALDAQWSPDGRFLAMQTAFGGRRGAMPSIDVSVLDTVTGTLKHLDIALSYVYELAWLPNGQQLLFLGQARLTEDRYEVYGLFMLDIPSGTVKQVLAGTTFDLGRYDDGGGVAIAPDGQKLVFKCLILSPDKKSQITDDICLSNMTVKQ